MAPWRISPPPLISITSTPPLRVCAIEIRLPVPQPALVPDGKPAHRMIDPVPVPQRKATDAIPGQPPGAEALTRALVEETRYRKGETKTIGFSTGTGPIK